MIKKTMKKKWMKSLFLFFVLNLFIIPVSNIPFNIVTEPTHYQITYEGLKDIKGISENYRDALSENSRLPDWGTSTHLPCDCACHFTCKDELNQSESWIENTRDGILNKRIFSVILYPDTKADWGLGYIFHCAADFYAHTRYLKYYSILPIERVDEINLDPNAPVPWWFGVLTYEDSFDANEFAADLASMEITKQWYKFENLLYENKGSDYARFLLNENGVQPRIDVVYFKYYYELGDTIPIPWLYSNIDSNTPVRINLLKNGVYFGNIAELPLGDLSRFHCLGNKIAFQHQWQVGTTDQGTAAPEMEKCYQIQIQTQDSYHTTALSEMFGIWDACITSPNHSTFWKQGEDKTIAWNFEGSADNFASVILELYQNNQFAGNIGNVTVPIRNMAYSWKVGEYYSSLQYPEDGFIATAPTGNGYTIVMKENSGTTIQSEPFSIIGERDLVVTSPNGSEAWTFGTQKAITWETGFQGPLTITLLRSGNLVGTIASDISSQNGSFIWTVGNLIDGQTFPHTDYSIRITGQGVQDDSDGPFSIVGIRVKEPGLGAQLQKGQSSSIVWQYNGAGNRVSLALYQGDTKKGDIASDVWAYADSYAWTVGTLVGNVPVVAGENYMIKVTSDDGFSGFSQPFYIIGSCPTTYTIAATKGPGGSISPSGNVQVSQGASQAFTITPDSGYTIADVKVDGVSQGAISTYTFSSVNTNHTIEATFSQVLTPQKPYADFDNDGISDIFWRYSGTIGDQGRNVIWMMNPAGSYREYLVLTSVPGLEWRICAISDLDGDGIVDIFWRYYGTVGNQGMNVVWLMNASGGIKNSIYLTTVADLNWKLSGAGDYNGDRVPDILWRYDGPGEAGGANVIWFMNASGGIINSIYITPLTDLDFKICGTSDFDGDGIADIFWRNYGTGDARGWNFIWFMNASGGIKGHVFLTTVTDLNWKLCGTGDYDGDKIPDILWRYYGAGADQGRNIVWLMDAAGGIRSMVFLPTVPDLNWTIVNGGGFVTSGHTLTATAGAGGTISPYGPISVNKGENHTFAVTPYSGYAVQDVIVDGVSQGAIASYTFTNVQTDHTIHATFKALPAAYTVTVDIQTGHGWILPEWTCCYRVYTVSGGSSFSVTLFPENGYYGLHYDLSGPGGGRFNFPADGKITIPSVNENRYITVFFTN